MQPITEFIHIANSFPIKVLGTVILVIVACAILTVPLAVVAALLRATRVIPAGGPTSGRRSRPPIPLALRTRVLARDNWQCVYCGSKENLQMDHIIPFSRGGATTFENLETLCEPCNEKKGAS